MPDDDVAAHVWKAVVLGGLFAVVAALAFHLAGGHLHNWAFIAGPAWAFSCMWLAWLLL